MAADWERTFSYRKIAWPVSRSGSCATKERDTTSDVTPGQAVSACACGQAIAAYRSPLLRETYLGSGNSITNRAPRAAFASSDRFPPCRSMMHLAIASPKPAPKPEALGPRQNRANRDAAACAAIPGPSSAMITVAESADSVIDVPGGVY